MGFFDSAFKAITRTALLPLDIASDTVRAVGGQAPRNTVRSAGKIGKDITNAVLDPFGDDEDEAD